MSFEDKRFILDSEEKSPVEGTGESNPEWGKFTGAGVITQGDVQALKILEGQSGKEAEEILENGSNAKDFGKAALNVLGNVSDAKVLKYTLRAVEDAILPNVPKRAEKLFASEADLLSGTQEGAKLELKQFVHLLNHEDTDVKLKALYVSSLLFSICGDHKDQENERKMVLNAACEQVSSNVNTNSSGVNAGLQSLSVLLRSKQFQEEFNARNGIFMLFDVMDQSFSFLPGDAQYHVVLCAWLGCFCNNAAEKVNQSALATLIHVLRSEPRLRVTRLCISTIRIALSGSKQRELSESVIEMKLPKLLSSLSQNRNVQSDPELVEDIEWMEDVLRKNFKVLTTYQRHKAELLTNKLDWSMIHEDLFWKENALKFEQDNFSSVKMLIDLLQSEDSRTVAIACSDIGYFVQYFPNGKLIVEKYGGKMEIMKLLNSESAEVQKHSLQAVSKLLVTNWEAFNQ